MGNDPLIIAGRKFKSRLIMGSARYPSHEVMAEALERSGAEMITVAIGRVDLDRPDEPTVLDYINTDKYFILPNTAGAYTIDEAIAIARLGRSAGLSNWVKLEVIGDEETLLPDVAATIEAARRLVEEGFVVLPYTTADPVAAVRLQEVGCATVMPLGSPIGSGRGLLDADALRLIRRRVTVPVIVDAGIGAPSDAALAMELGADAVLVNTAIAQADDPPRMAAAMQQGVQAGREGYLAGRIQPRPSAQASSPYDSDFVRSITGESPGEQ